MECFQAVSYILSLGEHVIAEKSLGYPATYRDIFNILKKANLINEKEYHLFVRLIINRNKIAHEHYEINEDELLMIFNSLVELESKIYELCKL